MPPKMVRAHGCAEAPPNWRMVQYNKAEENHPPYLIWFFEHTSTGLQIQLPTPASAVRYCVWCSEDLIPPVEEEGDESLQGGH